MRWRRWLPLLIVTSLAIGCEQMLGRYSIEGECKDADDCDNDEGCFHDVCRPRCLDSSECPEWTVCSDNLCSLPPGEPCSGLLDCTGDHWCLDVDANAEPTDPYCAPYCEGTENLCPPGYVCADGSKCHRQ